MLHCLLFVLLDACGMLVRLLLDIDHFLGKGFKFYFGIMHTASDFPVDFPLVVGIQEISVVHDAGQTLPLVLGHCQLSDFRRAYDTLILHLFTFLIKVSLVIFDTGI